MINLTRAKFKENGDFNLFKGNTVVANLDDQVHVLEVVSAIQNMYRELPFINKITLTPPESIHMTVIELLCDQNRQQDYWSKDLPLDMPIEEIDTYFGKQLEHFPLLNERIQMKVTGMGRQNILLEPANEDTRVRLNTIRDYVWKKTGVKFPNHYDYQFHITVGYIREELTPEESEIFKTQIEKVTQYVLKSMPVVNISRVDYTTFNSMARFEPYKV